MTERFDVAVVGAGFGGLGAALTASELGAKVVLLEALNYPGGCASTFRRRGHRFESGATLFSGFGESQLFGRWIAEHGLAVDVDFLDPVVEFRAPDWTLDVPSDRARWLDRLRRLPGTDPRSVARLAEAQTKVADVLWEILDRPDLLLPLTPSALVEHAARLPRYAGLLPFLGRPLGRLLDGWGVGPESPIRTYLDALCQITIQCSAEEAEAPFALATMDYHFRGTGHVRGGIGRLAEALVDAIRAQGQTVLLSHRVRTVRRVSGGWLLNARGRELFAERVLLNLLPHDAEELLQGVEPAGRLRRRRRRVDQSWGAAMLYWVVEPPPDAGPEPRHFELVLDPSRPLLAGNHVFCSISGALDLGRAPPGLRTVTVSTHVPMDEGADRAEQARVIQHRMRRCLASRLPEWWSRRQLEMTASPRTFARFTGRHRGFVGGVPRRAGLGHYLEVVPGPIASGAWMVGDSVFPGQSTLAAALGGQRTARLALLGLG